MVKFLELEKNKMSDSINTEVVEVLPTETITETITEIITEPVQNQLLVVL